MSETKAKYEAGPKWTPAERSHAADDIFEQLAKSILRGQLEVGSRVPSESALGRRFGVSRIIVRQAIHKLAGVELVRVRQGGGTIVLDPKDASNLGVLELEYRLGPGSAEDVYDFTERQIMQGHAMLHIAQRRGTRDHFEELQSIVASYAAQGATAEALPAFEERFWRTIAAACGNRLYQFETNWWFRLVATHPRSQHVVMAPPHVRIAALEELVARLIDGRDAAALYLELATTALTSIKRTTPPTRARKSR